jgi:xanthine dehydrogenase YagT iron-sulfur-binding subunit
MKLTREKKRRTVLPEGVSRRDFLKVGSAAVSGGMLVQTASGGEPPAGPEVVGPGAVPITLRINGRDHQLNVEPRVTLLDALRNQLDITGAKRVCDRGTCGACTVMRDGGPIYACSTLAIEAQGHEITTIEGLGDPEHLHPVMAAFVENDAQQCGFCTPGFVVAAATFLMRNPNPTADELARGLGGNLCRCGTYRGIKHAMAQLGKSTA